MKLLFENWRRYLNEVSFSDAKEILDSKRTLKIIKAYRYDQGHDSVDFSGDAPLIDTQHRNFKNYLLDLVPDDLTDNQKGTTVLWLLKVSRQNPKVAASFIHGRIFARQRQSLETFFHHQRFMPRQDLLQVKTMEDLVDMTDTAKEEIQKAQEKKSYLDAEEGTEIFRDDDEWTIAALHNKGAACELGKNTDWCTAAPGLDYFEGYYKPEDPLFFFQQKKYIQDDVDRPPTKYQFHYGSSQFMDSNDEPVSKEFFEVLHNLLRQTEAYNKYENLRIYDLKRMLPSATADIDEMRELLNTLEDPHSMANTLAEIATMEHFDVPTYVLRWLASEEFYKYTGVARRIVKYHELVPSDILEDLAENNPYGALRKMANAVLERRRDPAISPHIRFPR
tara:strand:+ start:999 stop:2174 length:1176 start_codon:yes stop_codon:yes gene_type:complete